MNYLQKKKLAFMSIVNRVKGFVRTITGALPLTLEGCVDDESIIDYTLYGQSVQNGTPTPETPVEVESVGDKTRNLFDINSAKSIGCINPNSTIQKVNGNVVIKRYSTTNAMGLYFDYHFKAGKYALKIDYLNTNYSPKSSYIMYFADKSICVNNSSVGYPNTVKQLNIPKDMTVHIIIYTNDNNVVGNECTFSIMLSEGYDDVPYEPYGYKIPITASSNGKTVTTDIYLDEPLRKVGEYADYIDFENGKVVRNVKEVVLDGGENWGADTTKTVTQVFMNNGIYFRPPPDAYFCDKFIVANPGDTEKISITEHMYIAVNKTRANNVTDFKKWLSENPTVVAYPLATPTETPITLPKIPTFKGTSIISTDTTIQPSNAEIEYYSNVKE